MTLGTLRSLSPEPQVEAVVMQFSGRFSFVKSHSVSSVCIGTQFMHLTGVLRL